MALLLSHDILKYICDNLNMHCDNSQCIFKLSQMYFNMSCDTTNISSPPPFCSGYTWCFTEKKYVTVMEVGCIYYNIWFVCLSVCLSVVRNFNLGHIFSAPEPKVQMHYCDHALSVVRPSLTFHIFDFSSETAERNSTKLDRKQDLNVLYQVCVLKGRPEKR